MADPGLRDRPRRLGGALTWAWATAVFFALGAVWSLATPLMDSPDEPTHALRAAAVWYGTIHGRDQRVTTPQPDQGEGVVATGILTQVRVPQAYTELQTIPDCYKFDRLATADCAPPVGTDTTMVDAGTYVGTYQPTYYLLVGWPTRLLRPSLAIRAVRLLSALLGAVLLGSGILSARRAARSGTTVIGAALAATPMALFLIGTVNPSGLEIAAAFATWLGLLELLRADGPVSTATVARVTAAAVLFALARPLSPVFVVLALAAVAVAAATRPRLRALAALRSFRIGVAVLGLALLVSGAWVVATHAYDAFTGLSQPGLTAADAARKHVEMLGFRARQLVGYLGNVDAPLPDAFVWLWLAGVGALALGALWWGRARERLAVLGALAATLLVPLVSEVSRANTYGFIWQGRYSLPIAVGVPILAAWVLAQPTGDPAAGIDRLGGLRSPAGEVVAAFVSTTMVVAHLAFMTRVALGYPNPLLDYLGDARWNPPVAPGVLLGAVVVASLAYGILLWRLSASTHGDDVADVVTSPTIS